MSKLALNLYWPLNELIKKINFFITSIDNSSMF